MMSVQLWVCGLMLTAAAGALFTVNWRLFAKGYRLRA